MANITLVKSLGVLAKSSPFSVTTVSSRARDELDEMKAWLFVQQDIEIDLSLAFPQFSRHSIMSKLNCSGRNEENEIHA